MRLQTVMAESELAALRSRAQNLLLQKERVEALLAGRKIDITAFSNVNPSVAAEHQQVHRLRRDHREKEHKLLLARIAQRNSEIVALEQDIVTQRKLVEIAREQLGMRQILARDGNVSKRHVLEF